MNTSITAMRLGRYTIFGDSNISLKLSWYIVAKSGFILLHLFSRFQVHLFSIDLIVVFAVRHFQGPTVSDPTLTKGNTIPKLPVN